MAVLDVVATDRASVATRVFMGRTSSAEDMRDISIAIDPLQPDQISGFLRLEGRIQALSAKELFQCNSSTIYQLFVLYPEKIKGLLLSQKPQLKGVLLKAIQEEHFLLFGKLVEMLKEEGENFWDLCDLYLIFKETFDNGLMAIPRIMQENLPEKVWLEMVEEHFHRAVRHNNVQLTEYVLDTMPVEKREAFLLSEPFIVFSVKDKASDEDRKLLMIDMMLKFLSTIEQQTAFILMRQSQSHINVVHFAAVLGYAKMIRILTEFLPNSSRVQFLTYPFELGLFERTPLFDAKNIDVVQAILDPLPEETRVPFIAFKYSYKWFYEVMSPSTGRLIPGVVEITGSSFKRATRKTAAAMRAYLPVGYPIKEPACYVL